MFQPARKKGRRPFSLLELLVVVAIILVLAGITIGVMGLAGNKASVARTQSVIKQLSIALESYKAKYGYYIQCPTAYVFYLDITDNANADTTRKVDFNFSQFLGDYEAFKNGNCVDDGGSPKRYYPTDAFGKPILYRCPGYYNRNGFDIGSVGANGCLGNTTTQLPTLSESADPANYTTNFGQGDDITNFKR